ncbi:MAG: acyl-[ACP]--phospholipid O-acyltransferase [Nitrospiria bacterium]
MPGYSGLFKKKGFQPFLWAQFLGAFNDNLYKIVVSMVAINLVADPGVGSRYLSLIGALFILPFFLFSGYAGHLADVYSKRLILILTKGLEIVAMALGLLSFWSGEINFMMLILFLMALQSTFFSPAKYGILPEIFDDKDLSRANALLEMTTFMAIILGTSIGSGLFAALKEQLPVVSGVMIVIAVIGAVASLKITKVSPSGAVRPFNLNPWSEIIVGIKRLYDDKPLWTTVIGISYFWFLGALVQMDILLLGKETMGLDDLRTGLLAAFLAIGIGMGSMITGRLSGNKVELGLVPIGSLGMGLFAVMTFLGTASFSIVALSLVLLGGAGGFFIVPLHAFLQQKSGKEEKGVLLATNNFLNTVGILLASGVFWFSNDVLQLEPEQILLSLGLFTFIGTIYVMRILPDFLIRFTLWLLTHTIYKIRIEGEAYVPFKGPALLVCNHVSFVDGLLVGACIQRFIRFLVYRGFFQMKGIGWFLKKMNAIPIAAGNRRAIIESIGQAHESLAQGHVVCIFAEGAISRTGNMLPFKKGFEHMVKGLDVPIIPVHLDGLWGSIFSFEKGKFFWKWPREIPFPVTVSFGKPLPATVTAQDLRQAVMELGSEAVRFRRRKNDLLHLKFIQSAKAAWKRTCLSDSTGKTLTYGNALIGALILSRKIRQQCRKEEMVGIMLPASVGGALANIATLLAGKVPVYLNFTAGKGVIDSVVQQCGIKTILTSKIFVKKAKLDRWEEMIYLEDLSRKIVPMEKAGHALLAFMLPTALIQRFYCPERSEPDCLATIIFSSGSTGEPKGVMLSHHNVLSNVESLAQLFWVTRKDTMMGVLPFFHAFGFTGTLWFPLIARFGAVFHPNPMDAKGIGDLILKNRATILISTPTFYKAYLRRCSKEAFASLRYAVVGAEKLREEIAEAFREKYDLDLLEGYGCTELSPVICVNVYDVRQGPEFQKGMVSGTVGHPVPGVSVKVVDSESGVLKAVGEEGLLLVKGPNLMMGYLKQPEKTAAVIQDGWYNTGDIACINEDGFVRITDRLSRFSKIGGEMVPHIKIEEEINQILGDQTCVVTAVPDSAKGERLVVLYTDKAKSPTELWKRLSETDLPKLWIPKKEHFYGIEEIPILGTGKTDLRQVKAVALARVEKG